MKMNKILAAGVAATMAVTSLAAVASAAERTFDMKVTEGTYTYVPKANKTVKVALDDSVYGLEVKDAGGAHVSGYITDAADPATVHVAGSAGVNYEDISEFIPVKVTASHRALLEKLGEFKVTISGRKLTGTGSYVPVTETATLIPATATGTTITAIDGKMNYLLPIYGDSAPAGCFMPGDFAAIDTIEIDLGSLKTQDVKGLNQTAYNKIKTSVSNYNPDTLKTDNNGTSATTDDLWTALDIKATAASVLTECKITIETLTTTSVDITAATKATATAPLNITGATAHASEDLRDVICSLIGGAGAGFEVKWYADNGTTADKEAWLPKTCNHADHVIYRDEVILLSKTGADESVGAQGKDGNQTYNEKDYNEGTNPKGFAGLASQVADFFNKQLNGTITFHFTAGKTAEGDNWLNGGIPSTEVGLRNAVGDLTNNDVALFVNYGSTTGSLQAVTEVKAEDLSVVFDISDILDALNGQTIGTVQDIYYGMAKGVTYDNGVGFWIDKVTLAYDEDADDGDIVDGDEEDGDVDVDVDGDEEDGDGEVDGDTDEDLPTDEDEAGEDENPGTGVALAVVPAIVAAAAVVVSKKRK